MTADLTSHDWKLLRNLVRAGGRPLPGRALRHTPNPKTRTGAFPGRLIDAGLLSAGSPDPDPFAATYALTPLGRHAAEYGGYDARMPWEKPPAAAAEPARPAPKREGKR